MTYTVANTANNNTFGYLIDRTNELASAMSNVVVTVNSNTATGNAAITGKFTANVIVANTITLSNSSVNTTIVVPTATQITNGNYFLNANGVWSPVVLAAATGNTITTGTGSQLIDNYSMAAYRSAEYYIHVQDNNVNNYQTTKILTLHNGGSAFSTEYATLIANVTAGSISSFTVTTNSTHVRVLSTPTSTNTSINFYRVTL